MRGFFARWQKNAKLRQVSGRLGIRGPEDILPTGSIQDWLEQGDERNQAREELFDLIINDEECSAVLGRHRCGRDTLEAVYSALLQAGAGQWAGDQWIPCLALTEPPVLEFLLRKNRGGGIGEEESFRVITYYQDDLKTEWITLEPELEDRQRYRRKR